MKDKESRRKLKKLKIKNEGWRMKDETNWRMKDERWN